MTDNRNFQEPLAAGLTTKRIQARQKRRITYDCMNAIVEGANVVCKKGHEFKVMGNRRVKGMTVLSVLRGMTSSACNKCPDYDGEEHE